MTIEVDQSGKVEKTHQDTILAFSNGNSNTIKITGKTKRKIQEIFRQIGEPKIFMIYTFCILVFLLIKDHLKQINQINIDQEYSGREKDILRTLTNIFETKSLKLPNIDFIRVGKKSRAHKKAIEVFRQKQQPGRVISFKELKSTIFKNKNRRPEFCRKRL